MIVCGKCAFDLESPLKTRRTLHKYLEEGINHCFICNQEMIVKNSILIKGSRVNNERNVENE